MNNRERVKNILNYKEYDRMPVVHFGFWTETVEKWIDQGYLPKKFRGKNVYSKEIEYVVAKKLGFDFGWNTDIGANVQLSPPFEEKIIEETNDGFRKKMNSDGVIVLEKEGAGSIPAEIDHTLKDRKSWEEDFKHRLEFNNNRKISKKKVEEIKKERAKDDYPYGIFVGSLYGRIRDYMGLEGVSYLYADDEKLYKEIIGHVANLCFLSTENILKTGLEFDFAHFWEDICFKNGPLVSPGIFEEIVGPHYKKITDLLNEYGIKIISLDCDGKIDALIPTWLNNGVNTMFPIEVGTWNASIKPWREKYGKEIRGVGGMDKRVFALDYKAIDNEVERLKELIKLGGYIPCPDHRIPPDAKWDNVKYYCEKIHNL